MSIEKIVEDLTEHQANLQGDIETMCFERALYANFINSLPAIASMTDNLIAEFMLQEKQVAMALSSLTLHGEEGLTEVANLLKGTMDCVTPAHLRPVSAIRYMH